MISAPADEVVDRYRDLVAPHPTVRAYFETAVAEAGDRPFIEDGESGETVSYEETDARANAVANELRELGLTKGSPVAVILPNCPEFVYALLGAHKVGVVPALVNIDLRGAGMVNSLQVAEPDLLVTTDALLAEHAETFDRFGNLAPLVVERRGTSPEVPYRSFQSILADGRTTAPETVDLYEDDPAVIPFSSGTTGLPKGILMPNLNYVLWGEFLRDRLPTREGEGYHNCLPLFHQAGLWAVYVAIATNGYFTLFDSFSRSSFWDRIDRFDCRGTALMSSMAQWIWDAPATPDDAEHALAWAFISGGPKRHREAFEERFDLEYHIGYGMTETHTIVWSESPTATGGDPLSDGRPYFHEVKVVDRRDRELDVGEVGEVVVRPLLDNIILKEYVDAYESTAEKLRNCWYHTGDLARLGEDGELYYEGRLDEYSRRKGENVSHLEVETIVNEVDAVHESAVIGVPDPSVGEEIKVHVVPADPDGDPEELFESIVAYCTEQLAPFKVPRYFETLDEFPRTEATERVRKPELVDRGREGLTETTWDRTTREYVDETRGS